MADDFFRPGFTQGAWANGELVKGLNYLAFVGNGLNTLSISAGPPGKSRNMDDDYFASNKVRVRLGTAFTRSREDRFSISVNRRQRTRPSTIPTACSPSRPAPLAPGVTIDKATYKIWAADAGIKWKGPAVNTQYFMRWLDDFVADGPLPLDSEYGGGAKLHFLPTERLWLNAELFHVNKAPHSGAFTL